ncbi:MAG: hypothetical protein PHC64_10760 [Candidatus Gastranaerophilales bacterium]|nr:hypothetical protein [Candidatus Gastranaerophilales bacterium]
MTEITLLPVEVKELALKVPENKQKEVQDVLNQIFTGTEKWEKQVDAIEVKDISDKMSIQLADAARLNVKKARIYAEKIFDAKREEVQQRMQNDKLEDALWLKSKQFMQLKFKAIEEKAEWKAKFVERHEAEQKEMRTQLRLEKISKFKPDVNRYEIENLTDEVFDFVLKGAEKAYNERIEIERKEKAFKENREKLYPYFDYIKDFYNISFGELTAKNVDEYIKNAKAEKARIEAENERIRKEKEAAEKKLIEERKKAEAERKAAEEKARKEREEAAEKLRKEQAERVKIEAELKAKAEAERKAAEEKAEAEHKAKSAPDKEKLMQLASDIAALKMPELTTEKANTILEEVKTILRRAYTYLKQNEL